MISTFIKYFLRFMIFARGHRSIFRLAILGLFLSSFSLLVLQGVMNGLQGNVIGRSKFIEGSYIISFKTPAYDQVQKISNRLSEKGIEHFLELEMELLAISEKNLVPVIVHGVTKDHFPSFLEGQDFQGMISPKNLAFSKLAISFDEEVSLMSPSHVDSFLGDVPRAIKISLTGLIQTWVPEIDAFHVWLDVKFVQSLLRKKVFNRLRIYRPLSSKEYEELKKDLPEGAQIKKWEDFHSSLVYALKMENFILIFLFISMGLLVSLSITSGLAIFFDRIKKDLMSFWILGASKSQLGKSSVALLLVMEFFPIILGVSLGIIFLILFDKWGGQIMPDDFVDRKIPVKITWPAIFLAFGAPFLISSFFSLTSFRHFKNDEEFISIIKSVGQ